MSADHETLVLIVADGVRADVLREELAAGHLPRLAARAARGSVSEVSSCFPSVTGPAYAPFMMGRFPASVGLPGLRWYDRAREVCRWPPFARSYVGPEIRLLDHDLHAHLPTLLELATPSVAGATLLGRGARGARHPGRGLAWAIRAFLPHFRGDLMGWRRIEQLVADRVLGHLRRERQRVAVMTFLTPDKFAHAFGARSAEVRASLRDIDAFVGSAEDLAARGGWAHRLHVWLVADHGHADVSRHDELADGVREHGLRVLSHPKVWIRRPDAAVMVGGNAMGHVYVELPHRRRPWWPALADRWTELHDALVARESVDLVAVALDDRTVRVSHASRGDAVIRRDGEAHDAAARWSYRFGSGDPLQLGGELHAATSDEAHDACALGDYPDAVVQLGDVAPSRRAGDFVLSAASGWDLRDKFEPTPHRSTHGALHREQIVVPLLVDSSVTRAPRRSADVMPSALALLGLPIPDGLDGTSWR
ncbi:MAG: alkaline phosphatase family protein [Candidatus Brachytrichaceae bacterium NZ_4S206]